MFLFARVRLDSDEDYTYESAAFWVSIGVLAILNIITSTLYIVIAVTCFRLLHVYPTRAGGGIEDNDEINWEERGR